MASDLPPSRTAPQFVVRLPSEEFKNKIQAAAAANGRSMNAEIVARLQMSFDNPTGSYDGMAAVLVGFEERMGSLLEEARGMFVAAREAGVTPEDYKAALKGTAVPLKTKKTKE